MGQQAPGAAGRTQYAMALTSSRRVCRAGRPPGLTGGISGANRAHSASERSVGRPDAAGSRHLQQRENADSTGFQTSSRCTPAAGLVGQDSLAALGPGASWIRFVQARVAEMIQPRPDRPNLKSRGSSPPPSNAARSRGCDRGHAGSRSGPHDRGLSPQQLGGRADAVPSGVSRAWRLRMVSSSAEGLWLDMLPQQHAVDSLWRPAEESGEEAAYLLSCLGRADQDRADVPAD
jgi:hypothetical protein